MAEVPERLIKLVQDWKAGGRVAQVGIPWPRHRWIEHFPQYEDLFAVLPDRVSRQDVVAVAARADESEEMAYRAFLASMVWGYGNVGYARLRTSRCLEDPAAVKHLVDAARTVKSAGAVAGYKCLAGRCRIKGLGPAFGTKFLYFCSKTGAWPTALIFDSLVAGWLQQNSHVRINPLSWNSANYGRYMAAMTEWADAVGVESDEIELCIFRDAAGAGDGQWART
jgi:hypothetical protein